MSMPPQYSGNATGQDLQEKSPPNNRRGHGTSGSPSMASAISGAGFSLAGLNRTRIAEGFSTLKSIVCDHCCSPLCTGDHDQASYQPLPDSGGYGYPAGKTYPVEKPPLFAVTGPDSFVPPRMPATQAPSFACDDPALVASYMESLQHRMASQPTNRESMVYPATAPSTTSYFEGHEPGREMPAASLSRNPSAPLVTNHVPEAHGLSGSYGMEGPVSMPGQQSVHRQENIHGTAAPGYSITQPYASDTLRNGHLRSVMHQVAASTIDMIFSDQKPTAAKRGPFRDPQKREETAQRRRIGSCIRCKLQRIRCNINTHEPDGPCSTCLELASKSIRMPCVRRKITDVKLFKSGQVQGYEWTRRWADCIVDNIAQWASLEDKFIRVTEGCTNSYVELRVRQFVPQEGDKLERSWVHNGVKKSVAIPPYAIVDLDAAQEAYTEYINRGIAECFDAVIKRKDSLLWKTYTLAWRRATDPSVAAPERALLWSTLQLWMSIRLTTRSTVIVGEETLGMSRDIMDETSPIHGSIPLPPVMGAQLDLILIHQIQTKIRRDMLEKLQKMTTSTKQRSWLTTYLVTFILLHNSALITEHDAGYARKHGIKRRFARERDVEEYHIGANILLAYYHYCNKGTYPFSTECKDQELRALAELDDGMVQFVHDTRAFASHHKNEWEELRRRESYEDDYYFVCQLFEEQWRPAPGV